MIEGLSLSLHRRQLLLELLWRDFAGRYRASFGGVYWSFVQPMFLLAVYTVAFGVILGSRLNPDLDTKTYAFTLFCGLIVFNALAECLRRAPMLIVNNPNFVKKIVFPLEMLSWTLAFSIMVHAVIGVIIWVIGHLIVFGTLEITIIYLPLIFLAFFPVLLAFGWLLSAATVIVRDIEQMSALLSQALFFLTPVFYATSDAPVALQPLLQANPLTFIIDQTRRVAIGGLAPDFAGLALYFAIATLAALAARTLFRHLRPVFSDLL